MERVVHTQRFEVVRRLGAGATGVVYEAENRKSGERVALKALAQLDAGSLYRFKREFRALSGVSHPNLVTVNELFHEGGRWYLSMELVQGLSFVEHVRGARTEPDLARLRAVLLQLVRAVQALHEADRLHRDIKPSNVLVTEQGRLVVLDFGFVREIGADTLREDIEVVGTPAYMAPEQAETGSAQPASDWYAVGVMLFEALTGRLPFEGSVTEMLAAKLRRVAPRPSNLAPGIPHDLDQLCVELLARDPSRRPRGRALLEWLSDDEPSGTHALPPQATGDLFVGRRSLLKRLHTAFERAGREDEPRIVTLTGPSAIGKSALLARFVGEVSERGAWVLLGCCHERENVPYKALDGIIDALVWRMSVLSDGELALILPRYLGALTLQFPVLLRIPAIARQAARYARPADPHELRRHAASALRELLARIADHWPLVLVIDDLQWGDLDSIEMLRAALAREDLPGLLLVVAYCCEEHADAPALVAFADAVEGTRRRGLLEPLTLGPLEESEAHELATKLLGARASDQELLCHVVREAERVPLFIHELARHVLDGGSPTATLERLVHESVGRLSASARGLLELVAIASAPLPLAVARELIGASGLDGAVRELLRERLVRQAFYPTESLHSRHDQIRVIVKRTLGDRAPELHFALARQLAAHGADPELLAHHFLSGGDLEHAASYAAMAAEAAARALAFASAARCYELALAWGKFPQAERARLMLGLADALANAGRGRDAGEAYLRAAALASPEERLPLRARAVDQLLRAGYIEPGLALGDELLRELGLSGAQTGSRALVGLLARRSWLWVRGYAFAPRDPAQIAPAALTRVEAARALSLALGHMDPFAAAHMQSRHLMLALESGDSFAVSRALGYEAVYLAIEGAPQSERALSLLARQRALNPESTHPYLHAFARYSQGVVDWGRGRWRAAFTELDAAERSYRSDCVGAEWELLASQLFGLGCLMFLGDYEALRRRIVRASNEVRTRDDRLTQQWIFAWQAMVDLLRGDVSAARQALLRARDRLSDTYYTLPHLFQLHASTALCLYTGNGSSAYARIEREWPTIKRSQLLRMQVYRVEMRRLRVISALCAARSDPAARRKLLLEVERDLARLEEEDVPWAAALALALRGELRFQQGALDGALTCWELGQERLAAADMEGFAAATRRRIGLALGGEDGQAMVRSADAWFRERGVRDPGSIGRVHLAG